MDRGVGRAAVHGVAESDMASDGACMHAQMSFSEAPDEALNEVRDTLRGPPRAPLMYLVFLTGCLPNSP